MYLLDKSTASLINIYNDLSDFYCENKNTHLLFQLNA